MKSKEPLIKEIKFREKVKYGIVRTYPDCEVSKLFLDLTGKNLNRQTDRKTFSEEQLGIIEAIGEKIGFTISIKKYIPDGEEEELIED